MKPAPHYAPYPLQPAPVYKRWWAAGLLFFAVLGALLCIWSLSPSEKVVQAVLFQGFPVAGGVAVLWAFCFLARALTCQLNRDNAACYSETADRITRQWWDEHRTGASLVERVLLAPSCSAPQVATDIRWDEHKPAVSNASGQGAAVRHPQVHGDDVQERERQLAVLLALQWHVQRKAAAALAPQSCYWQGSMSSWTAFAAQATQSDPTLVLPERPELFRGIDTLDSIIDSMQGAAADSRVLCAGCQSTAIIEGSPVPAGEAAFLWVMAPSGGVRACRGEWYDAGADPLAAVAERAMQQAGLTAPTAACVSFAQPDMPDLPACGWNLDTQGQDAHFGALPGLQGPVALTLAAMHVAQQGVPCSWLAADPHHTLALGIVNIP